MRKEGILSPREKEVLVLLAQGKTNKGICRHLGLSDYTIKDYVGNILFKLGAVNRTNAVAEAFRRGLIS